MVSLFIHKYVEKDMKPNMNDSVFGMIQKVVDYANKQAMIFVEMLFKKSVIKKDISDEIRERVSVNSSDLRKRKCSKCGRKRCVCFS